MAKRNIGGQIEQHNKRVKADDSSGNDDGDDRLLAMLPLKLTGALAGTKVVGIRPRTKNAVLYFNQDVRPLHSALAAVKARHQWPIFLERCLKLPGFKTKFKTTQELEAWLYSNADQRNKTFLGDGDGEDKLKITVMDRGQQTSQFLQMDTSLSDQVAYSPQELEARIPRPPNTKSNKRHTLVLHKGGFGVMEEPNIQDRKTMIQKCKLLLDLEENREIVRITNIQHNKKFALIGPNSDVGVFYESAASRPVFKSHGLGSVEELIHAMKSGELKSLMQKLIRYSSSYVQCGEEEIYVTSSVLQCLMETALLHPGGFVPQLQTNVRGLVSLFKRLAVTIVEDAWVGNESGKELHLLLLAACVAQADPDWFPIPSLVQKTFEIAQSALLSTRSVVYDCSKAPSQGIVLSWGCQSDLERASAYLDWLKSFPWDLTMVRHVAKNRHELQFEESQTDRRPDTMNIEHYIDHHTAPHLAYYMNPKALKIAAKRYDPKEIFGDMDEKGDRPYAKLFRCIFHTCTGVNYRRKGKPRDPVFCKMVQEAQARLLMQQYGSKLLGLTVPWITSQNVVEKSHVVEYEFDSMVLASEIPQVTVVVASVPYYVFLTRVEPEVDFGVVRVPTRDHKDIDIDPEHRTEAIAKASEMMSSKAVALRHGSMFGDNRKVILSDGKLYFESKGTLAEPWFTLSSTTNIDVDAITLLLCEGNANADKSGGGPCHPRHMECLRRLYRLTEGFVTQVEFPKITRCGGADDRPVHLIDVALFQLCLKLSPLFVLHGQRNFKITDRVVWFHIRENVLEQLIKHDLNGDSDCHEWKFFEQDTMKRTLTSSQTSALQNLQKRNADANLLVMDTGSGKTLVVMKYMQWLAEHNRLPKKVLFVTPKTAVESVMREISCFTSSVCYRSMRKRERTEDRLKDYTITVLEHDDLRKVGDIWNDDMPECLFVLDEFHYCLDESTQRTKYMQQLASCCAQRIGLSATPVINTSIFGIKSLLAPLCPFEITTTNFFVAYSYVVQQRQVEMQFEITDTVETADAPPEDSEYWDLLPDRFGGKNSRRLEPADLLRLMDLSIQRASVKMVELCVAHVAKGDCVFLVAKTSRHAQQLADLLRAHSLYNIYCIKTREDAITLTPQSIAKAGQDERFQYYDVVIAPIAFATGYSTTICNVQISTVYPSNIAGRAQIRGRIKRLGSKWKQLEYVTVLAGVILSLVWVRYNAGDSFLSTLRSLNN